MGRLTNLIALKVIFFPTEPTVRDGSAAGLMMKRQTIAMQYAQIFTHDLLTAPKIVDTMLNGPGGDRARRLIADAVKPIVDRNAGAARTL